MKNAMAGRMAMPNAQPPEHGDAAVKVEYDYVHRFVDDHGREYFYYRPPPFKRKTRIGATIEEAVAFSAAYADAKARHEQRHGAVLPAAGSLVSRPMVNTFRWLCIEHFKSQRFKDLDGDTQRVARRVLEACWSEPWQAGSSLLFGDAPLRRMDVEALEVLRDRKAGLPEAARSRLKNISRVFDWAVAKRILAHNPCRDVEYPKANVSGGFHTWSREEVAQFESFHPIGTKARLAMALLLFTGQRGSDVVLLGKQHVRDGCLRLTQQKNRNRRPVTLQLPILSVLQASIDAGPTGDLVFLVTEWGKPFSRKGFGQWFRKQCDRAGLPHCTAHGLRKAGATIAAENGATAHQLKAIFGWSTLKQPEIYTKAAEQKQLAEGGMRLLVARKDAG
jgi:integrase